MVADRTNFNIRYEGKIESIEAKTYLNSLLGITEIIEIANEEICKEHNIDKKITLNIDSHQKGSFIVGLQMIIEPLKEIIEIFNEEGLEYSLLILEMVTEYFGMLKILVDNKISTVRKVEGDNNNIEVITEKGNNYIIKDNVFNFYNDNPEVNHIAEEVFNKLAFDDNIEGLEINDDKDKTLFRANKSEIKKMGEIAEDTKVEFKKEVTRKNQHLKIVRPAFEDHYKWTFYYNEVKISANINDEKFWEQIEEGEPFSKGDTLIGDIKMIKVFDDSIEDFKIEEYIITSVKKHKPHKKPLDMFDE